MKVAIDVNELSKKADEYVEDHWRGKYTHPEDLKAAYDQGIRDFIESIQKKSKIEFYELQTTNVH